MNTKTRFRLGALLAVTVALATAGTSAADKLTPPPASGSSASGSASTQYQGPYYDNSGDVPVIYWEAATRVKVSGLQPNTRYFFRAVTSNGFGNAFIDSDRRGRGDVQVSWVDYPPLEVVYYYVFELHPDGSSTVILSNYWASP